MKITLDSPFLSRDFLYRFLTIQIVIYYSLEQTNISSLLFLKLPDLSIRARDKRKWETMQAVRPQSAFISSYSKVYCAIDGNFCYLQIHIPYPQAPYNPSSPRSCLDRTIINHYNAMILIPLLLMVAGYLIMSWVLFLFPTLLHKPHRHPKVLLFMEALFGRRVLKIAHRGGPRIRTENTLESFREAAKHSDMLQMDVCQTKDGVLVVHHDHDLQRTCGVKTFVRDLNFKDLPAFKDEIELNFAPQGRTVRSNGQRIPTLEQIFRQFPEMPMNIELKTPSVAAIKEITKLIRTHGRLHNTILGIRNEHQDTLKQVDRKIMTFMRDREFFFYLIAMIFGLLPYIYIEEHTMQVPLWTQEAYQWKVREWGDNWKVHLFFKGLKLLNPLMGLLSYHLRKRGIMTYFWVCNCEKDFERALKFGACGIMTDDPPLLDEYLLQRNMTPASGSDQQLKKKQD